MSLCCVPAGSASCGLDVVVYGFDINQLSLPTPFYSVLASISVFMALSTAFLSINFPTTLRFLTLFLRSYFLPYWSCQLYVSFWKSLSALIFLSLRPFRLYFFWWILPTAVRSLISLLRSYFCRIGPFNYISLYENLLPLRYNPLSLTGLKVPTN